MKTVTVLDFTTGEVHIYSHKTNLEYIEEYLTRVKKHDLDSCQYMCTDKLILQIH